MHHLLTAVARTTRTHAGQLVCARDPQAHTSLALNQDLHARIALAMLSGKPSADLSASIARNPIAARDEVRTRLEADKRGRTLAALVGALGTDERMLDLLDGAKRTGEVDHVLLHRLDTMDASVTDRLARTGSHALAFAAALRTGSELTVEDIRARLTAAKPIAAARAFVAPLLARFPELVEDLAGIEAYASSVASSTALLGHADLARSLARLDTLAAHASDESWLMENRFLYFALLANPFTPASLIEQVYATAPQLRSWSHSSREHAEQYSFTRIADVNDAELIDWLLKRTWPDPRFEGKRRAWDLPSLLAAPALGPQQAELVIDRVSEFYPKGREPLTRPFELAAILQALHTVASRFPDLAEKASGVRESIQDTPTAWIWCDRPCAITVPSEWDAPGVCAGCEDDMSIEQGFGLAWGQHGRLVHMHALDAAWGEHTHAWTLGLELASSFRGTFLELRDLVHDSVA